MISYIIIDDEAQNISYLQSIIKEVAPDLRALGTAQTAEGGVQLIRNSRPDIVFLDIQLMGATGFEVLEKTREQNFAVIFTTAHEKYAIKAIRFAAIDYLLKPVDKIELIEAINRARELKGNSRVSVFLDNLESTKRPRLAISGQNSIVVMLISDLIYCEADGPYTKFYARDTRQVTVSSRTLKEYSLLLADHGFFRVHKSFLVNLNEIKAYLKADGKLLLSDGTRLDVSDKRKDELLRVLANGVNFL